MAGKTSTFTNNAPPSVDAAWLNLNQQEQNNLITGTGQSLSDAINNQQAISASRFAANNFYTDSGTADNYILILAGSFTNPVSSSVGYFEGMTIRFRPGNANTGGAAQVNVNGAGNKSLKEADGTTNPPAGVMTTFQDVEFRYDGSVFRRVTSGSAATTTSLGTVYINQPITISNNSSTPNTDIDFSAGNFAFSDGSGQAVALAMTKCLQSSGAWSAGNNGNMLLSGTRANNSTYHLFAIYNPTTGNSDFGALLGVAGTAPDPTSVLPSGYTKFKYLCALRTDGSGNIRTGKYKFFESGYIFTYNSFVQDRNTAQPTTPTLLSLTVPVGKEIYALNTVTLVYNSSSSVCYGLFVNPSFANTTPSSTNYNFLSTSDSLGMRSTIATPLQTLTNSSGQVIINTVNTSYNLQVLTNGWIDYQL